MHTPSDRQQGRPNTDALATNKEETPTSTTGAKQPLKRAAASTAQALAQQTGSVLRETAR
eukprot:4999687-Alexandrium_andersonii.AAC.1